MAIDLFGQTFQLNYMCKSQFTTKFSLLMTIFLFIISLINLIINLRSMILRQNLIINYYQTALNNSDTISFNDSNAFLGFSLFDKNYKPISDDKMKYFKCD